MKIRKDDNVIVISGKDKGKTGKVATVDPKGGTVVIAGVNVRKVHEKARKANQKGQIVEKPAPIHVSNVMLVDPKDGKPTRVGKKLSGDKYVRVAKKSGSEV